MEARGRNPYLIRFVILGAVCVVLAVVLGILWERRQQALEAPEPASSVASEPGATTDHSLEYYAARQQSALVDISGPITALGNGCSLDGRCSMTVDGKTVQYLGGPTNQSPNASVPTNMRFGGPNGGPAIGQNVTIKARSYTGGTYSIINCSECYLEETAP